MDFETLGIVIFAFIAGAYLGWRAHEAIIVHAMKTKPEVFREALDIAEKSRDEEEVTVTTTEGKTVTTTAVELEIEKVKGVLYAYSKASNQFIAQGETIEDLLKEAHARFPGKNFFGNLPAEDVQKS